MLQEEVLAKTPTTYLEEVNSRLDFLESKEISFWFKRPIEGDLEALSQAFLPKPPISPGSQEATPTKSHGKQRKIPEYFSWQRRLPVLPPEMVVEIASHMHPLDLLNYSRTCQSNRRILLSRGSRTAWNEALAAIPDLPPCPPDMSQPKYAALVFDCHCFACGARDAYSVDYALRVRFCETCYAANVSNGTELFRDVPRDVRDAVLLLVPTVERLNFGRELSEVITRINPVAHTEQDFFYVPELKAILSWFWPLPTAESFVRARTLLQQRVEYITERQTHAALLLAWNRVIEAMDGWPRWTPFDAARDAAQLSILIDKKKHLAVTSPRPDASDEDDGSDEEEHDYIQVLVKARSMKILQCSPPPKSTWQAFEEERLREDKEAIAQHERLQLRYGELEKWYQVVDLMYLDEETYDHAKLPNVYDGARLWEDLVDSDARTEIDARTFLDTLDELDEKFETYEDAVSDALAALVLELPSEAQDGGGEASDATESLALPIAMFACTKCDECVALPWPDINAHWRTAHPRESIWLSYDSDLKVSWWEEGVRVAKQILDALPSLRGLALTELDDAVRTGKLYCSCGDPSLDHPKKLSWAKLVHHVYSHARMDDRFSTASRSDGVHNAGDATLVWINDHVPKSCIKYNPDGADMEAASMRFRAEPAAASRINRWLDRCHDFSVPRCRICYALAPSKDKNDTWAYLLQRSHDIAYHMRAKHGKDFDESDVQFYHLLMADLQPGVQKL
ncbi:hypothetical protein C8T65DRAFT_264045 [Cerioporus squamosus]|nr:hypothetical protein C8T65DRAFT_264045 [Cerioporus squamosus]